MTHWLTVLAAGLVVAGCGAQDRTLPEGRPHDDGSEFVVLDGRVRFVAVEGGCWGIGTDSVTYEAVGGLPEDFRENDLPVHATVRLVDGASICTIGPLVEIVTLESSTLSP